MSAGDHLGRQFAPFVEASDRHLDSTYPLEAGGFNPYAVESNARPDRGAAASRLKDAVAYPKITHMRKSRLN